MHSPHSSLQQQNARAGSSCLLCFAPLPQAAARSIPDFNNAAGYYHLPMPKAVCTAYLATRHSPKSTWMLVLHPSGLISTAWQLSEISHMGGCCIS